jgi:hypothetical protein
VFPKQDHFPSSGEQRDIPTLLGPKSGYKIGNRSFQNVPQFKYLWRTVTNQNLILDEIKRRLNSGIACYHSVQNLLSYRQLSKSAWVNIQDYTFACCSIWVWTLVSVKEEHKLGVFENRVLRRTFGPKRGRVTRRWRKLHNEELHNLCSSPSIIRIIKSRRMGGRDMWHEWRRRRTCIGYW